MVVFLVNPEPSIVFSTVSVEPEHAVADAVAGGAKHVRYGYGYDYPNGRRVKVAPCGRSGPITAYAPPAAQPTLQIRCWRRRLWARATFWSSTYKPNLTSVRRPATASRQSMSYQHLAPVLHRMWKASSTCARECGRGEPRAKPAALLGRQEPASARHDGGPGSQRRAPEQRVPGAAGRRRGERGVPLRNARLGHAAARGPRHGTRRLARVRYPGCLIAHGKGVLPAPLPVQLWMPVVVIRNHDRFVPLSAIVGGAPAHQSATAPELEAYVRQIVPSRQVVRLPLGTSSLVRGGNRRGKPFMARVARLSAAGFGLSDERLAPAPPAGRCAAECEERERPRVRSAYVT